MNVGFVWLCGLVFRVTSLEMNCSVSSNDIDVGFKVLLSFLMLKLSLN